jgi:hypothetical protein
MSESLSDPFSLEESLSFELQVKSLAYAQGVNEGARRAVEEGRTAGLVRGWQAGADLGAARSMSSFVVALPWTLEPSFSASSSTPSLNTSAANVSDGSSMKSSVEEISSSKRESTFTRALRIAEQLHDSATALRPLKNKLEEDLVNDIQRVRAKTLVLGALAQLPAALDESSSSSSSMSSSSNTSVSVSLSSSSLSF